MHTKEVLDRFFSNVLIPEDKNVSCWEWIGRAHPSYGGDTYGRFSVYSKGFGAHRFSYEHFCGPINKDYLVHHICGNRLCVNPYHLEMMSKREHLHAHMTASRMDALSKAGRLVYCKKGLHKLEGSNEYYGGVRRCKECAQLYYREKYRKR